MGSLTRRNQGLEGQGPQGAWFPKEKQRWVLEAQDLGQECLQTADGNEQRLMLDEGTMTSFC